MKRVIGLAAAPVVWAAIALFWATGPFLTGNEMGLILWGWLLFPLTALVGSIVATVTKVKYGNWYFLFCSAIVILTWLVVNYVSFVYFVLPTPALGIIGTVIGYTINKLRHRTQKNGN
ncbi:MAG: hypothetical protein LBC38_02325 [Oscillospiraceae bacterium]|jgi:hypothetical protein|nr:hypothetical protein [Oscillospiraceae bacterium]